MYLFLLLFTYFLTFETHNYLFIYLSIFNYEYSHSSEYEYKNVTKIIYVYINLEDLYFKQIIQFLPEKLSKTNFPYQEVLKTNFYLYYISGEAYLSWEQT